MEIFLFTCRLLFQPPGRGRARRSDSLYSRMRAAARPHKRAIFCCFAPSWPGLAGPWRIYMRPQAQ
jgi:hypothetical protein